MASFGAVAVLACLLAVCAAQDITMVPELPVSGNMFMTSVTSSLTSGAGGTLPGTGAAGRRLLDFNGRSLLQVINATSTADEAAGTASNINAALATQTGRKLLQNGQTGLQISYAAKLGLDGTVTVLLEIPPTPGNAVILAGLVTPEPAGFIVNPATFFNAEVAISTAVAVSTTGFTATAGGVVRVKLTFALTGTTLPPLQLSWQYASNLPGQPPFFFINSATMIVVPDKAGLPTLKGLVGTLP